VPQYLDCPFLGAVVELSDERLAHAVASHLGDAGEWHERMGMVVRDPDMVLASGRPRELLFSRHEPQGLSLVVIVVSDPVPSEATPLRHWVVTAYLARRLPRWRVLWQRS
jgi:hypothetical protein